MFRTSGWAFSISSRRITLYGLRLIRSVSWPPSSWPTYPGGEPIILAIACFSMYSDMSKRRSDRSEPKQELRERSRDLGLPDARGAQEDERADRPVRGS